MCVFLLTFLWSLLFIVKYWTVLSLQASKKVFKWINLRYFLRSNFKSERKSLETTRIINWSTQILTLSSQVKGTIHATIKNIYVELFIHPGFFLLELEQDRSQFWCLNHQKNTKTQWQFLFFRKHDWTSSCAALAGFVRQKENSWNSCSCRY